MALVPPIARKFCGVSHPPLDGFLTLPEMVEFNATYNPTQPMYIFADEQGNGFEHVSYLEFNRACQRVAHAIRPATLQGSDSAIVGIVTDCNTLLHHTITFGIIYAGLIPFPISSRNSPAAIAHMMRKTGCQRLIAASHSLGALLNHVRDELASLPDGPVDVAIDDLPLLTYMYPKLDRKISSDVYQRLADDTVMLYLHRVSIEKIAGGLDDVLVHSSGEKTLPAPMESTIGSSPLVSGVCMFGRGRNQTGVLVEPRPAHAIDVTDERQVAEFRKKIWPKVEEANKDAPVFSRIFKEMILVTNKEKPMVRAAKGIVIKKATQALYGAEIGILLYASVELSIKTGADLPHPASWTPTEVENWLTIQAMAVRLGKPIQVDVNLFEQGFDSLSSTFLKNRILGSLRASPDKTIRDAASSIGPNVIFANPTLQELARYIIHCVAGLLPAPDPKTEIENMIAKYSSGFGEGDKDVLNTAGWSNRRHVVLLTGSTGGLGSYLLASLLAREDVDTVYAFNRPSKTGKSTEERQRATFIDREIDSTLLNEHGHKLVYLEGDTTQGNLSLDEQTYAMVRDRVTMIIHNAWLLHFNLGLSSFEGHVKGTRHLIDLGLACKVPPRFMFTSSVKSAQGWDERNGAFPEEVQMDARVAVGPGYGASKYVSERILAMSGLPATSFRIGQISGGTPGGAWSTKEWVPMFVKSSVALGALPDARGVVSWIPPQAVSGAILDVAFSDAAPPLAINLVHPRPVPWTSLMRSLSETMHQTHGLTQAPLRLIPLSEWVARLGACARGASEETVRRMPSVKLLGFMRTLAEYDAGLGTEGGEGAEAVGFRRFGTDGAEGMSEVVRTLSPLSAVDAARWVRYWVSVGWLRALDV